MAKLSKSAQTLKDRYIKKTSPENRIPKKKKRGLQAEINKIAAMKTNFRSDEYDLGEIMRLKSHVYELYSHLDYIVNGGPDSW